MALYQHRFSGTTTLATPWMFTWWSQSGRNITDAQAAAVSWLTTFWTGYGPLCTAGVAANSVVTSLVTQATGQQQDLRAGSVALAGSAAGNALPTDAAICVTLRTATINRSGRGRMFLPQPAASQLSALGRLAATTPGLITTALTNAFGPYHTLNDVPVIYSRLLRQTFEITAYAVGDLWDTQRGRQDRAAETKVDVAMPI